MEDSRVTAAHDLLREVGCRAEADVDGVEDVITGLLAYAEERLRINVGLIAENAGLKKNINTSTETLDLEQVSDDLLLSEVKRRFR